MEPILSIRGNTVFELPLPPFEFPSIHMEEYRCNKRESPRPSFTSESKKVRCSPRPGGFIFPSSPSNNPNDEVQKQGNDDLQSLQQEVRSLRIQVEELNNSESVVIGDLKSEIKKLTLAEPVRVKELNRALTNMQKNHKLLLKTETRRANELAFAMKKIHRNIDGMLQNSDEDMSASRSVYVSPNEKANTLKGIERTSSQLMFEYNEAISFLQREVNDINMNMEASEQVSEMLQDANGQTNFMSHDLPPLQNILAQVVKLTTGVEIHGKEIASFENNIKTSISAAEDMMHSVSKENLKLKNKVSRLQTEAVTNKVEAENTIENLKKELKEVAESENVKIGELKAENSRLRGAMMGNFSFDSSDLELMKSESDGSNESWRPIVLSEESTAIFQFNKGESVTTISNNASIGSRAPKPFNHNIDASSSYERLLMPRFDPRPKTTCSKSYQQKAQDEAEIIFLREQLKKKDNEMKALREKLFKEEKVDMVNYPSTPLTKCKNDDRVLEGMDGTPQRISELTDELNKWRIKATLLVEKKNTTRNLKKDNSNLKRKVEELRLRIKTRTKAEVTHTVSPGGIPPSPTNRCPI